VLSTATAPMLARPTNVSPRHCAAYFRQEDSQEMPGHWWGEGAKQLELFSEIDFADLQRVANGLKPRGYQPSDLDESPRIRKRRNVPGQMQRAGTDCVFSPAKGVSISALVDGDTRIVEVHRLSVKDCLQIMQSEYSYSRMRVAGEQRPVLVQNDIVAMFEHYTSRANDPLLHTHCVRMNGHLCPDGVWRSSENKELFRARRFLSQTYNQKLNERLKELGYRTKWLDNGSIDIESVSKKLIIEFSTRRKQIENARNQGMSKKESFFNTRPKKKHLASFRDLQREWRERSEALQTKKRGRGIAM
jgi:conjugative relaxase-like TrwC/TraI family protein